MNPDRSGPGGVERRRFLAGAAAGILGVACAGLTALIDRAPGKHIARSTAGCTPEPEDVLSQVAVMMSMPMTRDILHDGSFDLQVWAAGKCRETIDLLYDDSVLNGTVVRQPRGILADSAR